MKLLSSWEILTNVKDIFQKIEKHEIHASDELIRALKIFIEEDEDSISEAIKHIKK